MGRSRRKWEGAEGRGKKLKEGRRNKRKKERAEGREKELKEVGRSRRKGEGAEGREKEPKKKGKGVKGRGKVQEEEDRRQGEEHEEGVRRKGVPC